MVAIKLGSWNIPKPAPKEPVMVNISPEMALELLEASDNHPISKVLLANRPVSSGHVAKFVRIIKAGEWNPRVQSIHISEEGVLLNGQHRLWAIVESGQAVMTLVQYGCPPSDIEDIDQDVRKRSFSSLLAMRGVRNATTLAAISNVIYMIEKGKGAPTHDELDEVYHRFKDDAVWVADQFRNGVSKHYTAPVMAAFSFVRRMHPRKVDDLVNQLVTTEGRASDGAAIAIDRTVSRMDSKAGQARNALLRKVLRAIQLHCQNHPVRKLQDSHEGLTWARSKQGVKVIKAEDELAHLVDEE